MPEESELSVDESSESPLPLGELGKLLSSIRSSSAFVELPSKILRFPSGLEDGGRRKILEGGATKHGILLFSGIFTANEGGSGGSGGGGGISGCPSCKLALGTWHELSFFLIFS